ncbi:MAG: hypothetical protein WBO34_10720, partial [Gammaproteobacteria bacterium]
MGHPQLALTFRFFAQMQFPCSQAADTPACPREIQVCVSNGVCTEPGLQFDSPDMVVYQYAENTVQKALIGYELGNGSSDFGRVLGGPIWVSANQFYNLSDERHFFTLHLDQVIPQPANLWVLDSDGLDVGLSLTTADLLGGSGFFHLGETGSFFLEGELGTLGDQGQGQGLYPLGDNHSFLPCLADTCEVGAEFNLVNLAYVISDSEAALTLDLADNRKLLYSQFIGFDGERGFQNYYVKPIPLPA